jgi:hypothetical protein
MVPFSIICALLLLFFLLLINKTLEAMTDLNIQAKDISKIAKVTINMDPNNTNDDKISDINNISDFVDTTILDIINNPDTTNQQKLDILNKRIDDLYNYYRRPESIVSKYSESTPSKPLNSTEFKQILVIIFDDDIEDDLKVARIKALNIRYNEILTIIDDTTIPSRVKLIGMDEDDVVITQNTVLNALINPPLVPVKKDKKDGGGGGGAGGAAKAVSKTVGKAASAVKSVFKSKK